jgi:hypothetical protein
LGVVHDIPLSVHKVAYEADLLIATGLSNHTSMLGIPVVARL